MPDQPHARPRTISGQGQLLPLVRCLFAGGFCLLVALLAGCALLAAAPDSTADTSATVPPVASSSTPAPSATPTPTPDEMEQLAAAARLPRDQMALFRALAGGPDVPELARSTPLDVSIGHTKEFWVANTAENTNYAVVAELRYIGPVVLMYVEQGAEVEQTALEAAASQFEQQIYPRTRALFGSEWQPGVDGDPRIVILNVRSRDGGVAGYFSPRDSVPRQANRFSNEHEMFYMNVAVVPPGSDAYLDTLAHEFQHMIHWHEQRRSSTWFNEGNSTLSEDLNGFVSHRFASYYLADPDRQLTDWAELPAASFGHYGAAHLFMRYIYAQYAGEKGLRDLIRSDAGNNLDAFVQLAADNGPPVADFGELFGNWAVANLLNDAQLADGRYSYGGPLAQAAALDLLPATVKPVPLRGGAVHASVSQFGADYLELPAGPATLLFTGTTSVNLVGTLPQGDYAWWSGRGDNSVATLTRAFDLRSARRATLHFAAWYEMEQGYDYAFVSVSTDGGTTWQPLSGRHTTSDDPHGANYGYGLTGVSGLPGLPTSVLERGRWIEEKLDLSDYAGQEVLVRFWQINDEGFHAPGLLIDNIRLPQIGYSDDVEASAEGWQAAGFVRVDGILSQRWIVRLVRTAADGRVRVEPLLPDEQGRLSATLAAGEHAVLVVAAATPYTSEPASYEVTLQPQ